MEVNLYLCYSLLYFLLFDMEIYYKVSNTSHIPVLRSWIKGFLAENEMQDYEEFKKTPQYLGHDEKSMEIRRKVPESLKAKPFFSRMKKSVDVSVINPETQDWMVDRRWSLGPSLDALKVASIYALNEVVEKYNIVHNRKATRDELINLITGTFGSNTVIMTDKQLEATGLRALEKKEIIQKAAPELGIMQVTILTTGLLDIIEIDPVDETNKVDEVKQVIAPVSAKKLIVNKSETVSAELEALESMTDEELKDFAERSKIDMGDGKRETLIVNLALMFNE